MKISYRQAVGLAALLGGLWLFPLVLTAQVEEARARIDGMV